MPKKDQGIVGNEFSLIPRTLIFLTRGKRLLLIRGAPEKRLWAGRYNGIGGHVEPGEDVLSAARREVMEETGLEIRHLQLCGAITIETGGQTGVGIYILRGSCPPEAVTRPSREGALEWVPLEELYSLELVEDLPELLPKVLAWKPGDAPVSAHYRYTERDELSISFAK